MMRNGQNKRMRGRNRNNNHSHNQNRGHHHHNPLTRVYESNGPDVKIRGTAHHIADDFRARGLGEVKVRAEALVSLNGRPARPMIDSHRDLAHEPDGLAPKDWILPL